MILSSTMKTIPSEVQGIDPEIPLDEQSDEQFALGFARQIRIFTHQMVNIVAYPLGRKKTPVDGVTRAVAISAGEMGNMIFNLEHIFPRLLRLNDMEILLWVFELRLAMQIHHGLVFGRSTEETEEIVSSTRDDIKKLDDRIITVFYKIYYRLLETFGLEDEK